MFKDSLIKLSITLRKVTKNKLILTNCQELEKFYQLVQSLQHNVKQYLRLDKIPTQNTQILDIGQESYTKSVNLIVDDSVTNQQQISDNIFVLTSPKSLNQKRLFNKTIEKNKIRLATPLAQNKNFQKLMEHINLIILYQNKVEKLIQSIKNQKYMTDICLDENSFDFSNLKGQNKQNQSKPLDLSGLKDNIYRLIEQCKGIQQVQQNFKTFRENESENSQTSENQSHDKKSLLTQMLRQSQILDQQNEQPPSPKKQQKKLISMSNILHDTNRRLLKEIDFSDYKIQTIYQRKQKKVDKRNYGECSQCTIF